MVSSIRRFRNLEIRLRSLNQCGRIDVLIIKTVKPPKKAKFNLLPGSNTGQLNNEIPAVTNNILCVISFMDVVSSVRFSPLTDWVVEGTRGTIQQRSSSALSAGGPCEQFWHGQGRAGMSTLWWAGMCKGVHYLMLSTKHFLCRPRRRHPLTCPEGWFWRGSRDFRHARTTPVSVSWMYYPYKDWTWSNKNLPRKYIMKSSHSQRHWEFYIRSE